jgi:hypothetical protein
LTGDRARARGAENRADAPIHLIKRLQELGAGKYALFTYSLSPFIFFVAKKRKTRKIGGKEREKERERERERGLPREQLTTSNARKFWKLRKLKIQKVENFYLNSQIPGIKVKIFTKKIHFFLRKHPIESKKPK